MYKPHLLATILCCLAATPCLGQQVADTGQLSAEALAAATDLTLNGTLTTEGNSDFRKSNCLFYKYLIFIYFYQIMNF